jgi:small neutral amino acid transporter SnatA (MarC family)
MSPDGYNTADVFLIILIGVGPLKAVIAYADLTRGMTISQKRRVAVKTSVVAALIAALLLVFGDIAQHVFHFSHAALAIAGGMIMFLLGLDMALGRRDIDRGAAVNDPDKVSITPLAVPLTLNPVGVVALITYSSNFSWTQEAQTELMIAVVAVINIVTFLVVARFKDAPEGVITVIEILFGILLCAVAVQLVLVGLHDLSLVPRI